MTDSVGAYFESLVRADPRPYADRARYAQRRVRELLASLGDPHKRLRCVHIAGSKGKGSTALLCESVLRGLGYRTGAFLSPHLESWNERFLLDGQPVDESALRRAVDAVAPSVTRLGRQHPDAPPSFFDTLTACACWLFREHGVDYALFEAGLGGTFDATTVIDPVVGCITAVELEHTDKLGERLEDIAVHKAGIIKPGVPLVVGPLPVAAAEVVSARANALGAPLSTSGKSFQVETRYRGRRAALEYRHGSLRLSATLNTPSLYAAQNAALALELVRVLLGSALETNAARAAHALAQTALPGRAELLSEAPLVVVDSAHTADSARGLAAMLDQLGAARRHLVVSVTAGKAPEPVLQPLLEDCAKVTVTTAETTRSIPADVLAAAIARLAPALPVVVEPDPAAAAARALRELGQKETLVVAGSVYLAGVARRVLLALLG